MVMTNLGISKLVEETGELQQELGKILAYGLGDHPDSKGNLLSRYEDEAADVIAAIIFTQETLGADKDRMHRRTVKKLKLFREWHDNQSS